MFTIGLINQPNDMWKHLSLMLDSPKKIIVLLALSYFPTYSDLVLLPGFPLHFTLFTIYSLHNIYTIHNMYDMNNMYTTYPLNNTYTI